MWSKFSTCCPEPSRHTRPSNKLLISASMATFHSTLIPSISQTSPINCIFHYQSIGKTSSAKSKLYKQILKYICNILQFLFWSGDFSSLTLHQTKLYMLDYQNNETNLHLPLKPNFQLWKIKEKDNSFSFKAILQITSSVLYSSYSGYTAIYSSYTSIIAPIIHTQVTSCNRMLHH